MNVSSDTLRNSPSRNILNSLLGRRSGLRGLGLLARPIGQERATASPSSTFPPVPPLPPPNDDHLNESPQHNLTVESPQHDEVAATLTEMNVYERRRDDDDEFEMSGLDDEEGDEEGDGKDTDSEEEDELDIDDGGNISKWVMKTLNYSNVEMTVSAEGISRLAKSELLNCIAIIKNNINLRKQQLHFRPNTPSPSESTKNFLIFANENFFASILAIINENECQDPLQRYKTTMYELENTVRVILASAFYRKSPKLMASLPGAFPLFDTAITECGGVEKFKHIIKQLKSPKPLIRVSWNSYFKESEAMRNMERVFSENCSRIVNHETMRSLTIDDHKFRFRSKKWDEVGIPRRKGLKSFGPVMNIACQSPTGLVASMRMSGYRENMSETMKIILQRVCNAETYDEVDMNGGIIHGDRGYEFEVTNVNARQFNTTKRNKALPYTFGECRSQNTLQMKIPESGIKTIYSAQKKINKKTRKELCAYRSGTGSVVLLTSTDKEHSCEKWSLVIESFTDARKWCEGTYDVPPQKQLVIQSANLVEMTVEQSSVEWFQMRKFTVTSTVGEKIIRLSLKHGMANEEMKMFLSQTIGMRVDRPDTDLSDDLLAKALLPIPELNKLTVRELKDICRAYRRKVTGNKSVLIQRVQEGPVISVEYELQGSLIDEIIKCWMMKPLPKTDAMKIGSVNEAKVLESITNFVAATSSTNEQVQILGEPMTFGLVSCQNKPWLATSVDGLTVLTVEDGTPVEVPIEIKTFSGDESKEKANDIAKNFGEFFICTYGDDRFKKAIGTIGYRVQVLHHATVFKAKMTMFVAANKNSIIFMMLVNIPEDAKTKYENILQSFFDENLKWITSDSQTIPNEVADSITEKGISRNGYHIDSHSVKLHFAIRKQMMNLITIKKRPLPKCKLLVPTGVAYWNSRKGPIDVFSRLLSHLKVPFGKAGPTLQMTTFFILSCVVQGCLVNQYEMAELRNDDPSLTFESLKKRLSSKETLEMYLFKVISDFQIPSNHAYDDTDDRNNTAPEHSLFDCIDDQSEIDAPSHEIPFSPISDRKLRNFQQQLNKMKRKAKATAFQNDPLAKRIRLSKDFDHSNTKRYDYKGVKCILCGVILKQTKRVTTSKGCSICQVPLCDQSASKFTTPKKSCWYIWHNEETFKTSTPHKKTKKTRSSTSSSANTRGRRNH